MTLTPTNDETSYHGNLMDALPVYGQPVLRGGSQLWLSDACDRRTEATEDRPRGLYNRILSVMCRQTRGITTEYS